MSKAQEVEIDGMPVEVNSARWKKDPDGYTKEIREKRREQRLAPLGEDEPYEDYDAIVGDDS